MSARRKYLSKSVLAMLFFAWGLVSVLIDMSIPVFKGAFELSFQQAFLVQFAFFTAYLFLGRLSGAIVARLGLRTGVLIGLGLMITGALSIVPATFSGTFNYVLPAIFAIACGITFLQVSANPLAAGMAGGSKSAGQLTLVQGLNSLGTFAAPFVASLLFFMGPHDGPADMAGVRLTFTAIAVLLVLLAGLIFTLLQTPQRPKPENAAGTPTTQTPAGGTVPLIMGMAAIFVYVGAEVSISSTLINFLSGDNVLGVSAKTAASLAGIFWGGALIGRLFGSPILVRFGAARVLTICTLTASALLVCSGLSSGRMAAACILGVGLFNGVQFPTIFALSISGRSEENRARASGWLCTAIVGGGIIPLLYGRVADTAGLSAALIVPALCYIYICLFARVAARSIDSA